MIVVRKVGKSLSGKRWTKERRSIQKVLLLEQRVFIVAVRFEIQCIAVVLLNGFVLVPIVDRDALASASSAPQRLGSEVPMAI